MVKEWPPALSLSPASLKYFKCKLASLIALTSLQWKVLDVLSQWVLICIICTLLRLPSFYWVLKFTLNLYIEMDEDGSEWMIYDLFIRCKRQNHSVSHYELDWIRNIDTHPHLQLAGPCWGVQLVLVGLELVSSALGESKWFAMQSDEWVTERAKRKLTHLPFHLFLPNRAWVRPMPVSSVLYPLWFTGFCVSTGAAFVFASSVCQCWASKCEPCHEGCPWNTASWTDGNYRLINLNILTDKEH